MKYVLLTEANSQGISEVFHSVVIPDALAAEGQIARWNEMASASPLVGRILTGKENVAVNSVWNEESQSLTLAENVSEDAVLPTQATYYSFFINNVLKGIVRTKTTRLELEKFEAALARPVTIVGLSNDEDLVDIGYTYNGSAFSAPEIV